jgi:glycosyltransferase involved in cell wall biosynthesis
MLPPPMTGQALMFKRAVDALQEHYDLRVIDTQFQKKVGEAGLFSLRKVLHFFTLLFGKMIPAVSGAKIDVLYYCVAGPSALGLIKDLIFLSLLRPRAGKTVYHFHGAGGVAFLMRSNALLRAWTRLVLLKPDLVLRPASPSEDATLCEAKRDFVISNGIEDPTTMVTPSMRENRLSEELSFAFVGVVTEGKGVFDLVEIARLLKDRGHRFTLSIVGDGKPEEITRLKQLIGKYDLERFVCLTGVLIGEQKFKLLQQTTVFLFPTFYQAETQPTAIMEALALSIPAVAYDWRGVNTIIDQGVNGYVVPLRDTVAFCQAIEQIIVDGKIDSMRAAARRIFLERFTLERHVEALKLAFNSVDGENGDDTPNRKAGAGVASHR